MAHLLPDLLHVIVVQRRPLRVSQFRARGEYDVIMKIHVLCMPCSVSVGGPIHYLWWGRTR